MEAAEAKIQRVLEGTKMFLVPHYQRPYSWKVDQWKTLWLDLVELLEDHEAKPHFLGSIVSSPARSVPEGVEKRLLIDGQQRLTTILILLTLIRDLARDAGSAKLADRIDDLVTNRHEEGVDHLKLLPTQSEDPVDSDREAFLRMVAGTKAPTKSTIGAAYEFFASKLRRSDAPDLEELLRVIVTRLTLVSIILDEKDNPHRIFESLNGKGRPLSHADLIRNYFFMRLPEKEHDRVYFDVWRPMQRRVGEDSLTDFVRHYLTRFGSVIRETDVYSALKARVDEDPKRSPIDHLQDLARCSEYYAVLVKPELSGSQRLRTRLERLNRLEVTVAYPFLLAVFDDFTAGKRTEDEFCAVLDTIENFLVRRFVYGVPTYGLNKVFAALYEQAVRSGGDFVSGVRTALSASTRGYPRDAEFRERLGTARLYGAGDRQRKTKLILERLEGALGHKETVSGDALTIEHVMPQTLTDAWKEHLGASWEEDQEQFLHTLGNLTLTSYNAELSNAPFVEKKKLLATSHVELNRYFEPLVRWTAEEVEARAEALTDHALALWPYFGAPLTSAAVELPEDAGVTGKVPRLVRIRGEEVRVQSWVDVAIVTMEAVAKVGDEEFGRIVEELPRFANFDATAFRRSSRLRKLSNGAYVETNHSASTIHRLCLQAVQLAELSRDEWSVDYSSPPPGDDDGEQSTETSSQAKQVQLEFWTEARTALQQTGKFPSLQTPRAQYWFDVGLGRSGIYLSLAANTMVKRVGVRVMLSLDASDRAMDLLLLQREAIEHELDMKLEWNPYPEKRNKTIRVTHPADFSDRAAWPAAIAWLANATAAFYSAFAPRVAKLDLAEVIE